MEDVSVRTGLPLAQLEALEAGTADRIADRVTVLKTLRRYADFLGLPGDRYVIALVDYWPAQSTQAPPIVALQATGAGAAGAQPTGSGTEPTGAVPIATAVSGTHIPPPSTTTTPRVAASPPDPAATQTPLGMADTGVTPVITLPSGTGADDTKRPLHTPLALRLVVGLVALAILAGLAVLVLHRYEPHWLDSLGITHSGQPPGGDTRKSTVPHSSAPGVFTVTSTSSDAASFEVRAPVFLVRVIPVGGDSWMQATEAGKANPTFAGVLGSGQSKYFFVQHSLTLEVGSADAHVFVSVGTKVVGFYYPPTAPYTMTFKGVAAS
jgi:hypothetical protein